MNHDKEAFSPHEALRQWGGIFPKRLHRVASVLASAPFNRLYKNNWAGSWAGGGGGGGGHFTIVEPSVPAGLARSCLPPPWGIHEKWWKKSLVMWQTRLTCGTGTQRSRRTLALASDVVPAARNGGSHCQEHSHSHTHARSPFDQKHFLCICCCVSHDFIIFFRPFFGGQQMRLLSS